MVFVGERRTAEVDETQLAIGQDTTISTLRPPIVRFKLAAIAHQQDIFRLQIGVDEIQVVEERDTGQQLCCKVTYVFARKRRKVVRLEEIKDRLVQELRHDTDMVPVIETVSQVDTITGHVSFPSREDKEVTLLAI